MLLPMSCHYPDSGHDWCAQIEDQSFWFQHRNEFLVELMRRFPPEAPLYDVGGGNGVVSAAIARAGIRPVVVEPGPAGARRARERGLEAIASTLEDSGLPRGSLPSIGLFDVIEHIEDSLGFLKTARAFLKPGGRMYVAVPAYEALWSAEDDYAKHFRRYTRTSLHRELTEAGLTVEYTTAMFSFLVLPILLLRSIPYRYGRAKAPTLDSARSDHAGGKAGPMLAFFRDLELLALRGLGSIPVGTSVVAIARNQGQP
jgi:SAM-dependent methyltransferase